MMADPNTYDPSFSFSGYQTTNPDRPLPGPRVDDELQNISDAIGGLVDAVKDVRRSDGKLQNYSVTYDSLSLGLRGQYTQGVDELIDTIETAVVSTSADAATAATASSTATAAATAAGNSATAAAASAAAAAGSAGGLTAQVTYLNSLRPIDPVHDFGLVLGTGLNTTQANANTVKIFQAATAAVAAGVPVKMPRGVTFEVGGGTTLPNFTEFDGNGSILRLANGQNATTFYLAGSSRNARRVGIKLHDMIIDGNAQNQTGAFYPFAWWNCSDLTIDTLTIQDFWATAMNGNDLDNEGTYSGNPWYNTGNGVYYNIAAAPAGEQTSNNVTMRNVKTRRSQANLDFANGAGAYSGNPHPTMWVGDQFVVGKVAGLVLEDIDLQWSGQNGLAIQFCEGGRVVDFKGQLLGRHIYLETCHDMDIIRPHIRDHIMIDNQPGNTADTFGIWLATGDQSYPGVPYAGCDNIRIRDPYIHNISRTYSASGRFKGIVLSGNDAGPNKNCSVRGAVIRDVSEDASSPQDSIAIMLEGKMNSFDISGNTINNIGTSQGTGILCSAAPYGSSANSYNGGGIQGNRIDLTGYPIAAAGTNMADVAIANNSLGSGRANVTYPGGGALGTGTNF